MRIAALHFHLRRGGVTSVMTAAAQALRQQNVTTAFACGEIPDRPMEFPVVSDPGLAYGADTQPDELLARLLPPLREALGGEPDVWHIHNHAIGKNTATPRLVRHLAEQGRRLLLHLHDFAEDFRPVNYSLLASRLAGNDPDTLQSLLYPGAPQVHYALLTTRDRDILASAGIPDERLHVLPNPAVAPPLTDHASRADRPVTYVYPVRAIRRKNIGELLLWAGICGDTSRFIITLPPTSEVDQGPYRLWKEIAADLRLPVEFEAGTARPYPDILAEADAMVTTSIAEGFGLVYAEPWLMGKPLAGRRIDGVARDLECEGIRLDSLYERMLVPLRWLDIDALHHRVRQALDTLYRSYALTMPDDGVERALHAMTLGDAIDFGRLDEPLQAAVLHAAAREHYRRGESMTPDLLHAGTPPERIEANRRAVIARLGPDAYAVRLGERYRELAGVAAGPVESLKGTRLVSLFLKPENLYLLRT